MCTKSWSLTKHFTRLINAQWFNELVLYIRGQIWLHVHKSPSRLKAEFPCVLIFDNFLTSCLCKQPCFAPLIASRFTTSVLYYIHVEKKCFEYFIVQKYELWWITIFTINQRRTLRDIIVLYKMRKYWIL